eukprot:m.246372 g.246372  ORF g.246372 m.246372 type:complete len:64 (+) comp69119_c0_seq1:151-342(+)
MQCIVEDNVKGEDGDRSGCVDRSGDFPVLDNDIEGEVAVEVRREAPYLLLVGVDSEETVLCLL